jgi:uncharacterized membrane protein YfcA
VSVEAFQGESAGFETTGIKREAESHHAVETADVAVLEDLNTFLTLLLQKHRVFCEKLRQSSIFNRQLITMHLSFPAIALVCLAGLLLGVMGAIIGSTLLILVPLLTLLGMPIQTAIGTSKVSVIGREIVPAVYFHERNLVKLGMAIPFSISAVITSYCGSLVAVSLNANILEKIVAVCMCLISLIIFTNPGIGLRAKAIETTPMQLVVSIVLGALIGFYTGIFGGGANVFIIFGFVLIFGNEFLQATANSKLPNLFITAASLPVFIANGLVDWQVAVPLALSTAVGAHFGARLAVRKGSRFIRNLFVVLVLVLAVKFLAG